VTLIELLYWLAPLSIGFAIGFWLADGVSSVPLRIGAGVAGAVISQALFLFWLRWLEKRWEKAEPPG
jgi:hypothetical protein